MINGRQNGMCHVVGEGGLWGGVEQVTLGRRGCVNKAPGRKLAWCVLEMEDNTVLLELWW